MLVGKYESNATALRLALQYRYVATQRVNKPEEEGAAQKTWRVKVFVCRSNTSNFVSSLKKMPLWLNCLTNYTTEVMDTSVLQPQFTSSSGLYLVEIHRFIFSFVNTELTFEQGLFQRLELSLLYPGLKHRFSVLGLHFPQGQWTSIVLHIIQSDLTLHQLELWCNCLVFCYKYLNLL